MVYKLKSSNVNPDDPFQPLSPLCHCSLGLGLEPNKDLVRTNIRFCEDHRSSKEHKK